MRNPCSHLAPSALAFALVLTTTTFLACSREQGTTDATVPAEVSAKEASTTSAPTRPPFPSMATASWGASVMTERARSADTSGGVARHLSSSLQALHSVDPGAAAALQKSAASVYATAEIDADRALGASLLAVGLVLDESPLGYKERLIDAHGLAAYAGTFEGGTAVAQAGRALVAISAGRVYEGEKLIALMSTTERVDADSALLLALARYTMGERGDALLAQARTALEGKPESARTRALLARVYLDLGLPGEALRALDEGEEALGAEASEAPLLLLRGLAQLALGQRAEGAGLVERALVSVSEVQRGEAAYRAGVAAATAGEVAKAEEHGALLSSLTGFEMEHRLLSARLSLTRGDASQAKAQALEVCKARGVAFTVAYDCLWVVTEACAAAGDEGCVHEWGQKAVGSDDDFARLAHARATLAKAKAGAVRQASAGQPARVGPLDDDTRARLREAHLFSPFDAALGKQLGLPVARGGDAVAQAVRGARRALAFGAKKAADTALEPLVTAQPTCRVCRALRAFGPQDAEEAARRAVAAVNGQGPPLTERDLLKVIDVLGGSADSEATAALEKLAKDPRPAVKEAVETAKKDQQNPEARSARKAKEAEAIVDAPGTAPVPGVTPPGVPHHHDH